MPTTGRATAAIARARTAAPAMSPAAEALGQLRLLLQDAGPRRAQEPRQRKHHHDQAEQQQRHGDQHPDGHHGPCPGLEDLGFGVRPAPRQQPQQGRLDALEEVRDAGGVGQDVVAVEPDQGEQLPDHLEDLGDHHQQQGVKAGGPPEAHDGHGHDGVEVQPAQVGADPAAAAQPVGIGDVGEERRPDQVEAGAHGSRRCAAAACGGGMAELVEAGGQHGHGQDQQHQGRVGERIVGGGAESLDHQHPPARGQERCAHGHHDQRVEQHRERGREPAGALRIGHGVAEAHAQQRVGLPAPPAANRRPAGAGPAAASWESISVRTLSALTSFPKRALTCSAICRRSPVAVDGFQHQIQQA